MGHDKQLLIDQTEPSDTGAKKEWGIYLEECKKMGIIPFTKTGFSKGNVNTINESDEKNNNTSGNEIIENGENKDSDNNECNSNNKDDSLMDVKNEKIEHN